MELKLAPGECCQWLCDIIRSGVQAVAAHPTSPVIELDTQVNRAHYTVNRDAAAGTFVLSANCLTGKVRTKSGIRVSVNSSHG